MEEIKPLQNTQKNKNPSNLEAEQALLGSILVNNDIIDEVSSLVKSSIFYDPAHIKIYEVIESLNNKGMIANPITLKNFFEKDNMLKEVGGTEYLVKLTRFSGSAKQAVDYAKVIHEMYLRRELVQISDKLSSDNASSESAWLHAIDEIEKDGEIVDLVVGMQPTSPIRHISDIEKSIELFNREGYDSILSVSRAADRFIWHLNDGKPEALNYDFKNRKMRQKIKQTFIENGSFYLFKPSFLKQHNNRLAGKIGFFELEYFKMFQIDEIEDVRFCEMIMREYL